jgi:Uma2 family endonuclease
MSAYTEDYIEALSHVPPGGRLTLHEAAWEEYERLIGRRTDSSRVRISYDQGNIEIMSPSAKHEKYTNLIHDLVLMLGDELEQDLLSYGSVTLKLRSRKKGAEGDDCFYIQNAGWMTGRDRVDLATDPPPDLLVEVDVTNESSGKLEIYAAMAVPEIWRYAGAALHIFGLSDQTYSPVPNSLAFPFLTAQQMTDFVKDCESRGTYQARKSFRSWVRTVLAGHK